MASSLPKPGHRALRKGRGSESGRIYLVTTTTHRRIPYFAKWELASRMSAVMDRDDTWLPHAQLLCWILMPDHWHGLVQLSDATSLSKVIGLAKGRSARAVGRVARPSGQIWAAGFHDRAMRCDDDVLTAARYIVTNPVRAGLVTSIRYYPYWNSIWL
ncbi:REP-associated tyrosine transposase [Pseudoxanthomonas putridarboris]|uniref:Transposase n=1 Tax=Pseudoxanthomonas putridarboris TaxID=752605 RepID=A0ABU9J442_9GAMM